MSGKSELKIFDDHPPQVVVDSGYFEDVHPRTSLSDSANLIEFFIAGSNVDYLDLNDTLLSLQIKILNKDGTGIKDDATKPYPANYTMHAMFSDISLSLNDTQIEGGGGNIYPYKAAIEGDLSCSRESKDTELYCSGYEKDKSKRREWIRDNNIMEFIGTLRLDFFNQPKYLLPGVNVRLRLTRSSDDFVLSHDSVLNTWKIDLIKAVLYVRRVKVHPTITKAHNLGLQTKNAIYPYHRTKVISFTIPKGSSSFFKDNLFSTSILPKMVVIAMVNGRAFAGDIKHDAIAFQDNGVSRVELLRDGQSLPYRRGYSVDFAKGIYTDVYVRSVLQNLNLIHTNMKSVNLSTFHDAGACYFVFNLTPDFDLKERQVVKDSNLRLDLTFHKALPAAINVIAYALYDATLQITKNREIIRDAYT